MGAVQSTELTSEHLSCGAPFVEENVMDLLQLLVRLNEIEDMIESKMLEKEQEKEAKEQQHRQVQEEEEQQEQEEQELGEHTQKHYNAQNQFVGADHEADRFDEFDLADENCEIDNNNDEHNNINNNSKERECQEKEQQQHEEVEVQSISESVTPEFTEKEVQELLAPFQTLHFANRYLDDESILHAPIEVCRVLSRHTFLSELDLSYNQLTAQSLVPLIESLTPLQHLKRLNLSGIAPVAEHSVCHVLCDWLSTNPSLTTLSLMQCGLHNEHVLCICNALAEDKNTHLKELNMMFNEFDWKGLVVLIEMLKSNTTLAILRVDSNSYLSSIEQVEEKRLLYGCTCAGYFRNGQTYYNDKPEHDTSYMAHETNQKEEEEREKMNSGNDNNNEGVTVNNVEKSAAHQENKEENVIRTLNAPRSASAERFLARRQFLTHELHGYGVLPPDLLAQIEEILKPRREQYLREHELLESLQHENLEVEEGLEKEQEQHEEQHDENNVAHDQSEHTSGNNDVNGNKEVNRNILQIDVESVENASNNKDNESNISENGNNIHHNDHDNKIEKSTKQDRHDEDTQLYAALDETIHHYKQRMRNRNKLAAAAAAGGGGGNATSFTKSMSNNNYNNNNNNKTTTGQHFLPSINSKWHVASAMTQAYTYRAKHNPTLSTGKPKLLNNGFDLIKLGGIITPESYYTHNGTSATNQHQHQHQHYHNHNVVEQSMQMETEVYDDFTPLPHVQQDEQPQIEHLHQQQYTHPEEEEWEEEVQQQGNSVTGQLYNKSKELIIIPNTVVNPLKCYLKPCWCDPHDASVKYGGTLHYHCKYEQYIEHNTNSKLTQTQLGSARSNAREQQRTKRANTKSRDGKSNKPEWNATSTTKKYNANASDSGNVYHRANNHNNSSSSTTPGGVNTNTTTTINLHRHESTSVFRPMGESSNKPNYARDFLHEKGQELQQQQQRQQQSSSVFASFDMANDKNDSNTRPLRRTSYHGCQGTGHQCISMNPNDLNNRVMSKNNITAIHGCGTGGNTESKKVISNIKRQQKRQMQLYNQQLQNGNTTQAVSSSTSNNTSSNNNIINTATQYVNKDGSIAVLHYNAVNYFSAPFQSSAENLVYEGQDELAEYEKESL